MAGIQICPVCSWFLAFDPAVAIQYCNAGYETAAGFSTARPDRPKIQRQCRECRQNFTIRGPQRYCSEDCCRQAAHRRSQERARQYREARQRERASLPPPAPRQQDPEAIGLPMTSIMYAGRRRMTEQQQHELRVLAEQAARWAVQQYRDRTEQLGQQRDVPDAWRPLATRVRWSEVTQRFPGIRRDVGRQQFCHFWRAALQQHALSLVWRGLQSAGAWCREKAAAASSARACADETVSGGV